MRSSFAPQRVQKHGLAVARLVIHKVVASAAATAASTAAAAESWTAVRGKHLVRETHRRIDKVASRGQRQSVPLLCVPGGEGEGL